VIDELAKLKQNIIKRFSNKTKNIFRSFKRSFNRQKVKVREIRSCGLLVKAEDSQLIELVGSIAEKTNYYCHSFGFVMSP
jgi:hypothetical protein